MRIQGLKRSEHDCEAVGGGEGCHEAELGHAILLAVLFQEGVPIVIENLPGHRSAPSEEDTFGPDQQDLSVGAGGEAGSRGGSG